MAGGSGATAGKSSPGRATLGARPGEIPFGWDNEFTAETIDVPAFDIDRYDVTTEQLLDFVEAGGYRDPAWWTPEAFAWLGEEAIEHPLFWAAQWALGVARHVRGDFVASRLTGLREPGRSRRVRALAGKAAAQRGQVPPGGVRNAAR